jgi:carbonic anhydrase/acetyltransferase-like protein (isoleucine patch superfamily)
VNGSLWCKFPFEYDGRTFTGCAAEAAPDLSSNATLTPTVARGAGSAGSAGGLNAAGKGGANVAGSNATAASGGGGKTGGGNGNGGRGPTAAGRGNVTNAGDTAAGGGNIGNGIGNGGRAQGLTAAGRGNVTTVITRPGKGSPVNNNRPTWCILDTTEEDLSVRADDGTASLVARKDELAFGWCAGPCGAAQRGPLRMIRRPYTIIPTLSWWQILLTLIFGYHAFPLGFAIVVGLVVRVVKASISQPSDADSFDCGSRSFLAHWFIERLQHQIAEESRPLHGTMYMKHWARLMGAKLGHDVEMSSSMHVRMDTLTVGDKAFIADDVIVGALFVHSGMASANAVTIGDRSFIGNGSFLTEGTTLPTGTLIALQTLAPKCSTCADATYLGSPPIAVPARQLITGDDVARTYEPSFGMRAARYAVEGAGFIFLKSLQSLAHACLLFLIDACYAELDNYLAVFVLVALPLSSLACNFGAALLVVLIKWITMCGRFLPGRYPLYSNYVWRTEFVERLEENVLEPVLLDMLRSAPV